ncbi:ABC transporter permease [Nocardioides solisilvae]|uniref:ABC transporter permease n=1 Tax=Nocardioides solisilvae TaxID=1542435 RepID=UPI000D74B5FF|nr:ABC transporter permease [Nocardioides solisilvae]
MAGTTRPEGALALGAGDRLTAREGLARQLDYWWTVHRRTWRGGVVSSFVAPLFYVVAMGVLLGGFVDAGPDRLEGATSYLAFVVPGLVAAHVMQVAVGETTYPVMGGIKWQKTYWAQVATPLSVRDVVNGQLAFAVSKVASASAVFLLVLAPFGVFGSWWGPLLAWLGLVLLGAAFAAGVMAFSVRVRNEQSFGLVHRLGVVPLTLFSGAFFPVANLGPVLEWVARATPLWHGVSLTRMLCLDVVDWPLALLHVLVLAAVAAVGWRLAVTGLERRMAV